MAKTDKSQNKEKSKLLNTTVWLTEANKKYLVVGKVEGKGSLSDQVNRLIEMARAAGWGSAGRE